MAEPNLHVALALALRRPTSWTDEALIADVETRCAPLREQPPAPEPQQFEDVPLPLELGETA